MRGRTSAPLPDDYRPGTLAHLFFEGAAHESDGMWVRESDGSWTPHGRGSVVERARRIALALGDMGFERGDRIGILSHTRLEWALADYGLITAGLVSVPVYPVLPADQVEYVLADAEARAVFVADEEQLAKILAVRDRLPELRSVVVFDRPEAGAGDAAGADGPGSDPDADGRLEVLFLDELLERGGAVPDDAAASWEEGARATRPGDLATLIYTSGTTGPPKGVMLTHANFHSNVVLMDRVFPMSAEDRVLSLLPLAHVFERTVGHYLNWYAGVAVAYAESPSTVARDLGEVRPTIMAAVPRVYEKVLERTVAAAREGGPLKTKIFAWARRIGERRAELELDGKPVPVFLRLRAALADRLVFSKLRSRTGGRIRFFASGGAPLSPAVARFFYAAGLPILEGYGLTETSPVLAFNPPDAVRIGTVGRPIPGTELQIAEDGEILARGPQIMKGYYGRPDATADAIDDEGWFHTGDVGEIDDEGYLRITDRKKDLIITAYGKNIAPQPLEAEIKREPLVSEAVMLGDGRKFPIVLVVPDWEVVASRWPGEASPGERLEDPAIVEAIETAVLERCDSFAHYQRPREVLIVEGPFTVEGGELTPTLKVKRRVVSDRFESAIDRLYERAARDAAAAGDDDAGAEVYGG